MSTSALLSDVVVEIRNSAVSSPSRATARKATIARPIADPPATATPALPSSSFLMWRAWVRIQKIIQVRRAHAAKQMAANVFVRALPSSPSSVTWRIQPTTQARPMPASVPTHTSRDISGRLLRFTKARTMATMRAASNPSRRVIRKLALTSEVCLTTGGPRKRGPAAYAWSAARRVDEQVALHLGVDGAREVVATRLRERDVEVERGRPGGERRLLVDALAVHLQVVLHAVVLELHREGDLPGRPFEAVGVPLQVAGDERHLAVHDLGAVRRRAVRRVRAAAGEARDDHQRSDDEERTGTGHAVATVPITDDISATRGLTLRAWPSTKPLSTTLRSRSTARRCSSSRKTT